MIKVMYRCHHDTQSITVMTKDRGSQMPEVMGIVTEKYKGSIFDRFYP